MESKTQILTLNIVNTYPMQTPFDTFQTYNMVTPVNQFRKDLLNLFSNFDIIL